MSIEKTRSALLQARDRADVVLSSPIRLVQEPEGQLGYIEIGRAHV